MEWKQEPVSLPLLVFRMLSSSDWNGNPQAIPPLNGSLLKKCLMEWKRFIQITLVGRTYRLRGT
jgi:hypothetical protein